MKKLLGIVVLGLFSITPSWADWTKVGTDSDGLTQYVNLDVFESNEKYIESFRLNKSTNPEPRSLKVFSC